MIRHHEQGNFRKKSFLGAYSFRWLECILETGKQSQHQRRSLSLHLKVQTQDPFLFRPLYSVSLLSTEITSVCHRSGFIYLILGRLSHVFKSEFLELRKLLGQNMVTWWIISVKDPSAGCLPQVRLSPSSHLLQRTALLCPTECLFPDLATWA